jgi:hypothetical protein
MIDLDTIPLLLVFAACVATQLISIEAGYRWGRFQGTRSYKPQMAQVRAIMGASLGLLAFMLAFSFNTAQQHFEERARAYMLEISAIDSAYRGADLMPQEDGVMAKELLLEFARARVETAEIAKSGDMEAVIEMVRESERMHDLLWALAESSIEEADETMDTGIFAQSVLTMINAHDARLQTIFFNRLSPIIWLSLLGMAVLSMAVTGYQAGLTGTRSNFATWSLAICFAFVMVLITDLDRPVGTLFEENKQLMVELQNRMQGGAQWDPAVHEFR